jgi:DNA-binding response OmpR family regulator
MSEAARRPRLLVVEDHADLAEALALNLRHQGHAVDCARDGYEALHLVRTRGYDLLILDLNLPRLDGLGMLERMRADDVWCPVLILSARGSSADKVEGFQRGADDYLTKPFTVDELLARVGALLRRAAMAPSAPAAPVSEPLAPADEPAHEPLHAPPAWPDVIGYSDEALVERFGLTLRQAQVTRLIAQGLTNPEIAEVLAISRFTVRNHTEQVLAKLGVPGRGRVAAALRAAYDADHGTSA